MKVAKEEISEKKFHRKTCKGRVGAQFIAPVDSECDRSLNQTKPGAMNRAPTAEGDELG